VSVSAVDVKLTPVYREDKIRIPTRRNLGMRSGSGSTKAVSSDVGVVLMVVVAVILAASVGVIAFDLGERLDGPGSVAGVTTDARVSDGFFSGGNYRVTLSHVAGDSLGSEDVRLIVRASAGVARVEFEEFEGEARRFRESSSKIETVTGPGSPPGDDVIYTFSGNRMPAEFGPGDRVKVVVRRDAVGEDGVEVVLVDTTEEKVVSKNEIPSDRFPGPG
jgi:FlaG/FlaF family flagellin (archaellin)